MFLFYFYRIAWEISAVLLLIGTLVSFSRSRKASLAEVLGAALLVLAAISDWLPDLGLVHATVSSPWYRAQQITIAVGILLFALGYLWQHLMGDQ
jgi:hypothetical protein